MQHVYTSSRRKEVVAKCIKFQSLELYVLKSNASTNMAQPQSKRPRPMHAGGTGRGGNKLGKRKTSFLPQLSFFVIIIDLVQWNCTVNKTASKIHSFYLFSVCRRFLQKYFFFKFCSKVSDIGHFFWKFSVDRKGQIFQRTLKKIEPFLYCEKCYGNLVENSPICPTSDYQHQLAKTSTEFQ